MKSRQQDYSRGSAPPHQDFRDVGLPHLARYAASPVHQASWAADMTLRSEQSSEQYPDDSPMPSFDSDSQDYYPMHGGPAENHLSPTEGIHALNLKTDDDRTTRSTPSSSNASGIKRCASGSFHHSATKKPSRTHSYVSQHELARAAAHSPPRKHHINHAAKSSPAIRNSDDFVASKFDNSQRVDSAFVSSPRHAQSSWPSKVSPAAGLRKENLPSFDRTTHRSGYHHSSGLFLQPETALITQEQLAAEVKGIYAGLVMVEAKSINIDAQQAADPTSKLLPEQWQALIALRRTLLYEHHDFLMATQHPSANPALRGLAAKYCMPARMWKHGIHGFLEVLRHRRPASQEYMLTFIYLAYDMMALLFETVPAFTDTWIECLGDLARYRMAIEEDKEVSNLRQILSDGC